MEHRPKRSLGQNFLRDDGVIDRIVDAVGLAAGELVIEIGPGQGALTDRLMQAGAQVVAVEFDRELIGILNERFGSKGDFRLIHDDALNVDFASLAGSNDRDKAKLVANLPYNISTPILQRLINFRHVFSSMVLMFQREVVERISAAPGDSERGFLTVLVENAFEVERLFDVPPQAFYPAPKVWSSVVRLIPKDSAIINEDALRSLVSTCFNQKRKTLHNNLKGLAKEPDTVLNEAGIDPQRRAQTLTLSEWAALSDSLAAHIR